jgi:outer membrane protein
VRIQEREKELQQMKESLEKQRIILTEAALKEKEIEYEKQYRDYKRIVEDANGDMQRMNQEITQRLVPEVLKIINVIGKKEGYLAVLDTDSPGLAYFDAASDISARITAEYDKEYKKGNK